MQFCLTFFDDDFKERNKNVQYLNYIIYADRDEDLVMSTHGTCFWYRFKFAHTWNKVTITCIQNIKIEKSINSKSNTTVKNSRLN